MKRQELLARLDTIEMGVNQMKVPASFADQFYALRGTIGFVRNRLKGEEVPTTIVNSVVAAKK